MKEYRIAVVDDRRADRDWLAEKLAAYMARQRLTYALPAFDSGEAFLSAIQAEHFDIVFMDVYMGGITGIEAAQRLRERDMDCKLVFLTTSEDFMRQGFSLNSAHYLVKPVKDEDFEQAMANCRIQRCCQVSTLAVTAGGVFCLLALVYGLCAAWLTVPVMRLFSALVLCFKIGAAFYLMAVSLLAIYRRIPQTAPLFYASAFYAAVLLWDRLLPAFEPVITGWFFEWGSLAMILIIGYTLWRDIVTAYSYNLAFAEEHRQMERQLAMQMEYANRAAERSAENRKLIHDFRQHLRAITEMASQIVSQPETMELQKELLRYLEDFPQIIP